jgi:SAM-dependent methyltransferase
VYYSEKKDEVSYPEYGNDIFFQVEDKSYWFRHRNSCITGAVKNFLKKDDIFFDVGGGNGYVSKGLQDAGIEVVLVEPGPNGVKNAKKRGVRNILCSSFQNAGFKAGSINALGLFDVLEHLKDDGALLKETHKSMAPGGHVFITVPAYNALWSAEDAEAGHFRRYTLKSLNNILAAAGFAGVYSTYIFGFLLLPLLLARALPYRLGLDRRREKSLEERRREHRAPGRLAEKIIDFFLRGELGAVSRRVKMPFGGSCLFVAKKK